MAGPFSLPYISIVAWNASEPRREPSENQWRYSRAVRVGDEVLVSGTAATDENGEVVEREAVAKVD